MSRTKQINTTDQWNILSAAMRENDYRFWQFQFSYNSPEGFHAWFWKADKEDVEVVTFSKEVQDLIIGYDYK